MNITYKTITIFIVLSVYALLGCIEEDTYKSTSAQKTVLNKVVHIVDGDTIDVIINAKKERVRLLYINTPERGQEGYEEANEAMRDLVMGKMVRLESEGRDRGRYDRLLRHVFLDGELINVKMIELGHTQYWTKYGKSNKYHQEYSQHK